MKEREREREREAESPVKYRKKVVEGNYDNCVLT
jgi:hypothetical protein